MTMLTIRRRKRSTAFLSLSLSLSPVPFPVSEPASLPKQSKAGHKGGPLVGREGQDAGVPGRELVSWEGLCLSSPCIAEWDDTVPILVLAPPSASPTSCTRTLVLYPIPRV